MLIIFNTIGEKIYSKEISSNMEIINCKLMLPGIYSVEIIGEKGLWGNGFVKE